MSGGGGTPPRPRPPTGPGTAHGRAAVLAARPDRPGRPGRGGHPARGLRADPGPRAARRGRPGADRAAAAAPHHRPLAGRHRLRRGDQLPVRLARRLRPAAAARRRPAAAGVPWPTRSATTSRCCAPCCCPACCGCSAATSAAASPTWRCSRPGRSSGPVPAARRSRRSAGGPGAHAPRSAALEAALPDQPLHLAVVLAGDRELSGWWGAGRRAGWQDAIEAARQVLGVSRVSFWVRADQQAPWHPGRCAALIVHGEGGHEWLAGHAGELHPRVTAAFGLPARTAAAELDMSVIETAAAALGPVQAPEISGYPVATQDVALIVADSVPAGDVAAALAAGAAAAGGRRTSRWRICGCSTSTPATRSARAASHWPTPCGSAPRTAPSPPTRPQAREAAVAEAPAGPARSSAARPDPAPARPGQTGRTGSCPPDRSCRSDRSCARDRPCRVIGSIRQIRREIRAISGA